MPIVGSPPFLITPITPIGAFAAPCGDLELIQYITPDGVTYDLVNPAKSLTGRYVISDTGYGTPPIDYVTERGPFQDGETVRDVFLRPRIIQLLVRHRFNSRVRYWEGRQSLLDALRPNRQITPTGVVPGVLRRFFPKGTNPLFPPPTSPVDLNVYLSQGPAFEPRQADQWDEWAFQEVIRFIAYDPVAFEATPLVLSVSGGGGGTINTTVNQTYYGNWASFPIITILGPCLTPIITNLTTGEKLEIDQSIAGGTTVTIDCSYGKKTITDQFGVNYIGSLSLDSDLATFHLAPNPEAPAGLNQLKFEGTSTTGATKFTMTYKHRYFGI